MFEVIYMKAEFEPWWMFEGWEKAIISRHSFKEFTDAEVHLEMTLAKLRKEHQNERVKKGCFFAFWTKGEEVFCEPCDEDLQIYYGVILMREGKPAINEKK